MGRDKIDAYFPIAIALRVEWEIMGEAHHKRGKGYVDLFPVRGTLKGE